MVRARDLTIPRYYRDVDVSTGHVNSPIGLLLASLDP